MFWSYLLTAVGVLGLYLVGSKKKLGWVVGIFAQVLWIAYALATHQYGFIISAFAYGWVYVRGFRKATDGTKNLLCRMAGHKYTKSNTMDLGRDVEIRYLCDRCGEIEEALMSDGEEDLVLDDYEVAIIQRHNKPDKAERQYQAAVEAVRRFKELS